MGASTGRKYPLKHRRRVEDDGEDEEGSVVATAEDDSMSEGSIISDADDDADAEVSDGSDVASPIKASAQTKSLVNGHQKKAQDLSQQSTTGSAKPSLSATMGDTEAMMNGLKMKDETSGPGVNFDDLQEQGEEQSPQDLTQRGISATQSNNSLGDKRRREHEEYKKRREADPSFVPNRGGFFMHDHRSAALGQNGFRPFGRGRAGARLNRNGAPGQAGYVQSQGPVDAPWAHDLHESVAQPVNKSTAASTTDLSMQKDSLSSFKNPAPNRSFSRSTHIGNVQVRVFFGLMRDSITFSAVPVNQHTRLPHHRPPLRRDKPVRISLPGMPIRAMRPNQQGFGKVRGRGSFGGGYNNYGPLSSRRTSAYAGSVYTPSVNMSRRSSLAREVTADVALSPTRAKLSIQPATAVNTVKPVVRLPPAVEQAQLQAAAVARAGAIANSPQPSVYSFSQKPTLRENRPDDLPMHHPKPERSLQVADIESPATLEFNPPPQQQQQPFHQQVPMQVHGQGYSADLGYAHTRQPSHPSQASGGTPLSQIPERAIHAQPFQPYPYQHPQGFFPQHFPPPVYFLPPTDQSTTVGPPGAAPPFVPGQPYYYPVPVPTAPPPPAPSTEPTTQAGTVAHESGGMVYYYSPSDLAAGPDQAPQYPPTYTANIGGMMTPPIQPYYPQPTLYFPPAH